MSSLVVSGKFLMSVQMKSCTCAGPCTLYNCSNIEDILRIRKSRFLQKYCALDNIVCALCRHQAETELVSLGT